MKKVCFLVPLVLLTIQSAVAQLDNYKYIIVPKKFETFKEPNKYHSSTLLKHLFTEHGFHAVYDDAKPEDLRQNNCLGLTADLLDESSMFTTKVVLLLKGCNSEEVFRSPEGSSKIKTYREAYADAIEEAFQSIASLPYNYKAPQSTTEKVTLNFRDDVKTLPKEDAATVSNKQTTPGSENVNTKAVNQVASPEEQSYKDLRPVASDKVMAKQEEKSEETSDLLYAQPIPNGFQLVDKSPSIRMKIYQSSLPDIYLAEGEGIHGLVRKDQDRWILEYYSGGERKTEELHLKF